MGPGMTQEEAVRLATARLVATGVLVHYRAVPHNLDGVGGKIALAVREIAGTGDRDVLDALVEVAEDEMAVMVMGAKRETALARQREHRRQGQRQPPGIAEGRPRRGFRLAIVMGWGQRS